MHGITQNACDLLPGGRLKDIQLVHVSHPRVNIRKLYLGLSSQYLCFQCRTSMLRLPVFTTERLKASWSNSISKKTKEGSFRLLLLSLSRCFMWSDLARRPPETLKAANASPVKDWICVIVLKTILSLSPRPFCQCEWLDSKPTIFFVLGLGTPSQTSTRTWMSWSQFQHWHNAYELIMSKICLSISLHYCISSICSRYRRVWVSWSTTILV